MCKVLPKHDGCESFSPSRISQTLLYGSIPVFLRDMAHRTTAIFGAEWTAVKTLVYDVYMGRNDSAQSARYQIVTCLSAAGGSPLRADYGCPDGTPADNTCHERSSPVSGRVAHLANREIHVRATAITHIVQPSQLRRPTAPLATVRIGPSEQCD